jgi:Domain of unknown function (DUF4399)
MRRTHVVTILSLATAACGGTKAATNDSTQAAAAPAGAPAAVPAMAARIVSPANNDSTGADVTVVLAETGMTIAKADGNKVEGTGHYHLFLDTPVSPDGAAIPPTSKNVVHMGTGDSTYTFKGLAPGQHELIVVVGYGDHTPMATQRDTVHFIVKKKS